MLPLITGHEGYVNNVGTPYGGLIVGSRLAVIDLERVQIYPSSHIRTFNSMGHKSCFDIII
jgi:hypothetical protein